MSGTNKRLERQRKYIARIYANSPDMDPPLLPDDAPEFYEDMEVVNEANLRIAEALVPEKPLSHQAIYEDYLEDTRKPLTEARAFSTLTSFIVCVMIAIILPQVIPGFGHLIALCIIWWNVANLFSA